MSKELANWLKADISRPLGFWGAACSVACPVSIILLKLAFYGQFAFILVITYLFFLLSLGAGVVALTRKGTTKAAPFVFLIVWTYLGRHEFLEVSRILALVLPQILSKLLRKSVG